MSRRTEKPHKHLNLVVEFSNFVVDDQLTWIFREHQVQEELLPNLLSMTNLAKEKGVFLHTLDTKRQGLSSGSNDKLVISNFESVRLVRCSIIGNRLTIDL